ncbi:hypothetical protein [Rhodopirellula europaea]|uniref:hypothetical protein n=1 Tax=Rhodopirellula europaea TaxID=1263866 RepID=UPI00034CCB81|nr:hypothetical protein [Rhodopirellula europaea]
MTTQDGNGLKDHDGGEKDRGKQAAVDWDAINASIRVKAWRGYKAGLYPQQDLRDIEQDLAVWVLERLDGFDPERGTLATFLKHALRSGLSLIVRRANAARRSLPEDAEMDSLGEMIDSSEGPPVALSETLTKYDLHRRIGTSPRGAIEQFEFVHDIDTLIALLPESKAAVARALMTDGPTKAQSESGLTVAHFEATVADIARHFAANDYDLFDIVADI